MSKRKGASELLGVMVKIGEIVEIDDGLTSNCFYLTLNGVKYLPYWDTARARKKRIRLQKTAITDEKYMRTNQKLEVLI